MPCHLHSIGLAMVMYCNDNKGYFPAGGRGLPQSHSDFIFWQQPNTYWSTSGTPDSTFSITDPRSLDNGALVKYMGGHFNANTWICPSDTPSVRYKGPPVYPYSYDMNSLLDNNLDQSEGNDYTYIGSQVMKMTRIRHTPNVIMMLEESSLTIDDGYNSMVGFNGSPGTLQNCYPR